jgi:hypothetical protein
MSVANPVKMVEAFGINAGPTYITAPFPVASQIGTNPGNASLNDGFTPLNMTALTDGGIPPSGADMNGILFLISTTVAAVSAGQLLNVYDNTYSTAIGGYAVGAQVLDATSALRRWTAAVSSPRDPAVHPEDWVSSTPILSASSPTAGTHADNVLAGASDFLLDINTAAGAITLNGFIAQRDGQRLVLSNTGANALTVGALAGTAGNQVRMSSAITLLQNDSITIQYCKALVSGVGQWVQV